VFLVNSPTKVYESRVLAHKYDMSSKMFYIYIYIYIYVYKYIYIIYIYICMYLYIFISATIMILNGCSRINYAEPSCCAGIVAAWKTILLNFVLLSIRKIRASHGPDNEFHECAQFLDRNSEFRLNY